MWEDIFSFAGKNILLNLDDIMMTHGELLKLFPAGCESINLYMDAVKKKISTYTDRSTTLTDKHCTLAIRALRESNDKVSHSHRIECLTVLLREEKSLLQYKQQLQEHPQCLQEMQLHKINLEQQLQQAQEQLLKVQQEKEESLLNVARLKQENEQLQQKIDEHKKDSHKLSQLQTECSMLRTKLQQREEIILTQEQQPLSEQLKKLAERAKLLENTQSSHSRNIYAQNYVESHNNDTVLNHII